MCGSGYAKARRWGRAWERVVREVPGLRGSRTNWRAEAWSDELDLSPALVLRREALQHEQSGPARGPGCRCRRWGQCSAVSRRNGTWLPMDRGSFTAGAEASLPASCALEIMRHGLALCAWAAKSPGVVSEGGGGGARRQLDCRFGSLGSSGTRTCGCARMGVGEWPPLSGGIAGAIWSSLRDCSFPRPM